ncbi:MAG: ATP synthase F1 subunit delta [Nitrospirota bacterium]
MRTAVIANRYAHALFLFAKENNLEKRVLDQVAWYQSVAAASVAPILENPKVPRQVKEAMMLRLFACDDEKRILHLFVCLLLRKGRIGYLNQIFSFYGKRYEEEMGFVRGRLTLAYPAEGGMIERLQSKLETRLSKKVVFDIVDDTRILGGFIFSTGTAQIDASISGALASMKARLMSVPTS